ncbi:altered inheritance rate of mitochondria protein 25 [Rutidosis leptorrhynchoides]|uniref:altered inheritance rate of mitochondria protein 25 n=1 Tax=Rutidosis leptorrhynchoides TaxID=125765 RepID=UPI003A997046
MNRIKNVQRITRLPKVISAIHTHNSRNCSLLNKHQNGVYLADKILFSKKTGLVQGDVAHVASLTSERKLCSRLYAIDNGPNLSRDFLVQLWVADDKMKKSLAKRKQILAEHASKFEISTKGLSGSYFSGSSVTGKHYDSRHITTQPLESASPEEAIIAPLLSRSNLLIIRDIEWANLTLGFEQENRYAIVDFSNPQVPAGFIREESNVIFRQLLRSRRPFVATITDGSGNELFRVRRPFWWITSSIYAEIGGKEIGVVHQRWHLWRRIYDLYLGTEQFAVVENPGFWYWTFTLKDTNGEVLAEIDRDWRGFGFEMFTDAGQYVIRFGNEAQNHVSNLSGKVPEFKVARPLTLAERAVTVALAVSLDNDYFSRHGGWGIPFIVATE